MIKLQLLFFSVVVYGSGQQNAKCANKCSRTYIFFKYKKENISKPLILISRHYSD